MNRIHLTLICFVLGLVVQAQESTQLYKKAIDIIKNTPEYKDLQVDNKTFSKESISFINQAYAFHLEEPDLKFIDYDFTFYISDFYLPIEITSFEALRSKRRAKTIFYVSETMDDHFIIEILSFKKKRKAKYPKFYNGVSYSFLFKKNSEMDITYIRSIRIVNN